MIELPPAETALDDSGYSIHGNGVDGIELSIASPEALSGKVTRLSPTVAWVMPETSAGLALRAQTHQVFLKAHGSVIGPLMGQAIQTEPAARGSPLGIQLVDVSVEQGRQILTMLNEALRRGVAEPAASALPVQEEVVDRERIRAVLSGIAAVGNKGVLRQTGRTVRIAIERCDAEEDRLYWRTDDAGADWGEGPYDIDVIGYNSAYRLRLTSASVEGALRVSPMPAQLWRIRHRWHRRVPAPPAVRIRFQHPLWGELGSIEREAMDISLGGLCVKSGPDDLLFPGLLVPRIELQTGDGEPILLRGEVRYVVTRANGQTVCGLSLTPLPQQEPAWVRFVSQTLCPTTRTSENLLEPLWEMFILSGYFNLAGKTSEDFERIRLAFVDMARRAAQIPQLFCQTVWPSERGIEATFSFMKPYRYTWLAHQLAKRPGKPPAVAHAPGQILRDVYLRTFEHSQSDPEYRWVLAYLESTTPFMERSHVRYARRMAHTGEALTMPLRLMDAHCDHAPEPTGEFDIGPATAEEKAALAAAIARVRPTCYVEALDLVPERLEMREMAGKWQGFGLRRERAIHVARTWDGRPLAALVLEVGQPGTNLFSLLDGCRIWPLAPDAKRAYVALLDEARRWYHGRGCTTFTYLREDDDTSYAEAGGLHDSDEAEPYLWIISSKLVPDFLEYVSELTVGRLPRSRQIG
ncbi:PilZ domain-containing protein [Myxococcaceae bacterium GXIMD 01537]